MINTPLVSIIVPVYNREKNVCLTLESIIRQSYTNLEIIVVNDGSTDGSLEIIRNYGAADNRIKIVNKENGGVSAAREAGLLQSKGDYIYYFDADDILDDFAIERLVNRALTTGADVVTAKFITRYKDKDVDFEGDSFDVMPSREYLKLMLSNNASFCLWIRLHKRSIYLDNNIDFYKGFSYGEDLLLMTQIFYYSSKVAFLDYNVMIYNKTEDSVTENLGISRKCLEDLHNYPYLIDSFLRSKGEGDTFEKECGFLHISSMISLIRNKVFDYVLPDIEKSVYYIKKYPELKKTIHRRFLRLIIFYSISKRLGLWYFKKKFGELPKHVS